MTGHQPDGFNPTEARHVEARRRPHRLRALSLAPAAQVWLEQTTSARVLHAFERACNLINSDEEIVALVAREVGAGPFSIVVQADGGGLDFSRWVEPGSTITIHQNTLDLFVVGTQHAVSLLVIDTRQAAVWHPRPEWERLRRQPDFLKAHLPTFKALLASHAPAGSLHGLVGDSRGEWPFAPTETTMSVPRDRLLIPARFLEAARPPAETLSLAIAAGDIAACREAAGALAGLGVGLTPAGDDFLLGAIYALWATRPPRQAAALADAVAESAAPRTSRLSAAWLRAAARGEAGQPWHTLVEALASNDGQALDRAVHSILSTGHTSGADALAGFILALGHLYEKPGRNAA